MCTLLFSVSRCLNTNFGASLKENFGQASFKVKAVTESDYLSHWSLLSLSLSISLSLGSIFCHLKGLSLSNDPLGNKIILLAGTLLVLTSPAPFLQPTKHQIRCSITFGEGSQCWLARTHWLSLWRLLSGYLCASSLNDLPPNTVLDSVPDRWFYVD